MPVLRARRGTDEQAEETGESQRVDCAHDEFLPSRDADRNTDRPLRQQQSSVVSDTSSPAQPEICRDESDEVDLIA
jgi:hypothetical protein